MAYPQDPNGGWQQPAAPPYGAPAAYPPPAYGYPARDHPDGTTVLILGILSLVVCGLLGPFAWSRGTKVLREIDAQPGVYANRGNVAAGRICGMIASGILILSLVGFLAAIILGAATSTTTR